MLATDDLCATRFDDHPVQAILRARWRLEFSGVPFWRGDLYRRKSEEPRVEGCVRTSIEGNTRGASLYEASEVAQNRGIRGSFRGILCRLLISFSSPTIPLI